MLDKTVDFSHFLFIDTATDLPLVAYRKDGSWECVLLQRGAELWRGLLRQIDCWQIDGAGNPSLQIVLGTGPGSYAGIRTGRTIAQALAFAWGIPLHCISSLDWLLPAKEGEFTACIDAKAGGVYAQKRWFSKGKNLPLGGVIHHDNGETLLRSLEEGAVLVLPAPLRGGQELDQVILKKNLFLYTVFDPMQGVFHMAAVDHSC